MSYDLSCVLLIPSVHKDAINAAAELLGYGPNNLSIELVGPSASTWYGCHTWCNADFLQSFSEQEPSAALAALVVSVAEGSSVADHWAIALAENTLAPLPAAIT